MKMARVTLFKTIALGVLKQGKVIVLNCECQKHSSGFRVNEQRKWSMDGKLLSGHIKHRGILAKLTQQDSCLNWARQAKDRRANVQASQKRAQRSQGKVWSRRQSVSVWSQVSLSLNFLDPLLKIASPSYPNI